ncbi:MAG: nicotinate-nucleotide adenylyltransferase [Planctomycetota bacterium]
MSASERGAKRVAVFGGSFDPIHNGHVEVAEAARATNDLDRVVFVPVYQQPHRPDPPVAPGRDRLRMIELAVEDRPGFEASDCELRRGETSYTVDTMAAFRRRLGPETALFFIVGSDSIRELPAWKDLPRLARLCTFIVAARPGWPIDRLDDLAEHLPDEYVRSMKSAAVRTTGSRASSSEVRERRARGASIAGLVPEPVRAYIRQNKLYRGSADKYDNKG